MTHVRAALHLSFARSWLSLVLSLAGCTAVIDGDASAGRSTELSTSMGEATPGDNPASPPAPNDGSELPAATSDLPCSVAAILAQRCQSCHQHSPPGSLLSSADFRAPSRTRPGVTVGQATLLRVQATDASRMPPAPLAPLTNDELGALRTWLDAGAPTDSCGEVEPLPPDPYDTPVVCTSGTYWTRGDHESPLMHPGRACIDCHAGNGDKKDDEGPSLWVGGTLFPTPHEPDDCNGVDGKVRNGAQVVLTDASGRTTTLDVNAAGNFLFEQKDGSFSYPYSAKVVFQGRERIMVGKQNSGDCNGCHTQDGAEGAPGRIFLP